MEMKQEQLIAAMQLLVQQNPQYAAAFQAQAQAAAAAAVQASNSSNPATSITSTGATSSGAAINPTSSATSATATTTSSINPPTAVLPQYSVPAPPTGGSKYTHLLMIIDEINKDIRPTYSGNRNCAERLKRGINHARVLVRECLLELDKQSRANAASSST